jgi:hypothetical protein
LPAAIMNHGGAPEDEFPDANEQGDEEKAVLHGW